jgi:glycosyltransferase involved in cell wall biosynthesis
MAGDGNLRNQMIELAAEMGISKKVFFPGFLDVEEVKDLFSITDLLVMPSVSEPFGLIAVEALSADVPVIVSKESGVSEILKSICSVDYWETEELANKMDELLHNDRKAAEMVQSCKKTLETQSWNSVARQVIKVYQNQLSAVN